MEFFQVCQQFSFRGPTTEEEAQHLESPFSRLSAGPQTDQQAGDDCPIRLDGHAILAGRQQVLQKDVESRGGAVV